MRVNYKANRRRPVVAEETLDVKMDIPEESMDAPTELLFEATDVADLIAEITGEEVEMDMDDDVVVYRVGEDEYTIEPEGDEEILEAVRKPFKNRRTVAANRRPAAPAKKKPVAASKKPVRVPRDAAKPTVRRK